MNKITPIPAQKNLNFETLFKLWMEEKSSKVKISTLAIYHSHIKAHLNPLLGNILLAEIDGNRLNAICSSGLCPRVDRQGELSAKGRIDLIRTLNNALRFGYENKWISQAIKVETPKAPRQKMNLLRETEQKKLECILRADFPREEAIGIVLCLYTGIRVGELCGLRWEDIDLRYGLLHIRRTVQRITSTEGAAKTRILIGSPKSAASEREIPIPDHLIDVLKTLKRKAPHYFFLSNAEQCFEPRRIQRIFGEYLEKAGLDHRGIHCTRHTFATRWVEMGLDVKTLSEILGHTSIRVTMDKYVHISEKIKRENINKIQPLCR